MIESGTLPGGSSNPYNAGDTLTHELGHAFGLLHTFNTLSCDGFGDEISDTPNEAAEGYVCVGTDTCQNDDAALIGLGIPTQDPTWNFMDYSEDSFVAFISSCH